MFKNSLSDVKYLRKMLYTQEKGKKNGNTFDLDDLWNTFTNMREIVLEH